VAIFSIVGGKSYILYLDRHFSLVIPWLW